MEKSGLYKRLRKYLFLTLGAFVAFEGALALATIPGSVKGGKTWLEVNEGMIRKRQNPFSVMKWLAYEVPHSVSYKFEINQVTEEEIREALENPETKSRLEELIQEDKGNKMAEIGGIITYDQKEKKLNFYRMESTNQRQAIFLENAIKKGQQGELAKFFSNEENWQSVKIVCAIDANNLLGYLQEHPKRSFNSAIYGLARFYIDQSDSNYLTYVDDDIEFYSENFWSIEGKFVGSFHIHADGAGPGGADLANSASGREIAIADTKKGPRLFDLRHEKSYEIN